MDEFRATRKELGDWADWCFLPLAGTYAIMSNEDIVGLELMRRTDNAVFFKIADGYGGHTQVLALFDRSSSPGYRGLNAATSTVDHIAFEIPLADYESEKARLESLDLTVTTAEHAWVHWRSLYVFDPEGNEVEWVCYDESVV